MKNLFEKITCEDCTDKEGNITNKGICPSCQNKRIYYHPVSPAQLAEIMGGAMWVVQELKKWLRESGGYPPAATQVWAKMRDLESQAPSSDLAREIREDREKAEAWDELYNYSEKEAFPPNGLIEIHKKMLREKMDELLAQSKTPPTAEEEKA